MDKNRIKQHDPKRIIIWRAYLLFLCIFSFMDQIWVALVVYDYVYVLILHSFGRTENKQK